MAVGLALLVTLPLGAVSATAAPTTTGYRDFSYQAPSVRAPSGEKPQSKLWHAHGAWWGALFDRQSGDYHIFRLDIDTQTWVDTGVLLDTRNTARLDMLWDGNKLYTVSAGTKETEPSHRVQVNRYSYDPSAGTYQRDSSFPVTLTDGGVEAAVLDRDSTGTIWVTWTRANRVWIAHSTSNDATFTAPYVLPIAGADTLTADDISAVVAYGRKIGVMWSNQNDGTMYFAERVDGTPDDVWTVNPAVKSPGYADDHISLRSLQADEDGRVFAVTKTSQTGSGAPLILVLSLGTHGGWSRATFGRVQDNHTRPILLIDHQRRKIYVFATAPCCSGGTIYYKESSLDNLSFEPGVGTPFIQLSTDPAINNATSTKQPVDGSTGMVVLASDDVTRYYVHNYDDLGGPDPDPTPEPTPDPTPEPTPDPTPEPTPDPTPEPEPTTTTTLNPTDDSRVHETSPNNNYRSSYLFTDAGKGVNIESYLRFDTTGLTGTVTQATLRLWSTTDTVDGPAVFTTDGGWTESTLTWATRPTRATTPLDDAGVIPTGTWTDLDVTDAVTSASALHLALVNTSTDGVKFASREDAAHPPQLVITTVGP